MNFAEMNLADLEAVVRRSFAIALRYHPEYGQLPPPSPSFPVYQEKRKLWEKVLRGGIVDGAPDQSIAGDVFAYICTNVYYLPEAKYNALVKRFFSESRIKEQRQ